ncbi:MAG: alpha-N-arabinofuranosidase [Spirochaetes bacterium]|nr:alpha-N-arabinofuranosidase [Spirochaetota bacterium]
MKKAKCIVDKNHSIAKAEPELFGSFIEHLGRAVYGGIYEPEHPLADEDGFRKDVIDAVHKLNVPVIRYPGGNFLSGYNWTDGIGPKEKRPRRLELAWHSIETNAIGIDEFVKWAAKANSKVMGAVNLGTGTPQEAANLVEYCNHPGGTYWSDLRIQNGSKDPYDIKIWCLGNEMDGDWQMGQLSSADYAKKAKEAAKMMRLVDPEIKLVACGSSGPGMATYPEWDRVILESLYEQVDFLSLHQYFEYKGDVQEFIASFYEMDQFIKTVSAVTDYVKTKTRSKKNMYLSFDEWNIWYMSQQQKHDWLEAPEILENRYTLLDALTVGGMICSLLNNSDRVKMACLAQLINVIAPIVTEKNGGIFIQPIYYPFFQASVHASGGTVLKSLSTIPEIEIEKYGKVPVIQNSVIYDREKKKLTVLALNCDQKDTVSFEIDARSFGKTVPVEHLCLKGDDLFAQNSFEKPENVVPCNLDISGIENNSGHITINLQPLSWNVVIFSTD